MSDTHDPFLLLTTAEADAEAREIRLVGDRMVIGRSPRADVVLDLDGVSRRHAELRRDDAGWIVSDLGSVNGTRVNGEPLDGEHRLAIGDRVEIETFALLYRI
ncbi:MAG: FHA domain-containing protein [Nannocystaceae bacterium]